MSYEEFPLFELEEDPDIIAAILRRLERGPAETMELAGIYHRFAIQIQALRSLGYVIKTEPSGNGRGRLYRLAGKVERVEVTDAIKEAYYKSAHWQNLRMQRINRDHYKCVFCMKQLAWNEINVHHWKYDLFNEDIDDICTLCRPCHDRLHSYTGVRLKFPSSISVEHANRLLPTAVPA